jgi:hypothetical protein
MAVRLPKQFYRVAVVNRNGVKTRPYTKEGGTYTIAKEALRQYQRLTRLGMDAKIFVSYTEWEEIEDMELFEDDVENAI